jgi:transcriptional regulator with XRE-family HTH domain
MSVTASEGTMLLAKKQKISQKQLAAYCNISRITVHRFFAGKTQVRAEVFVKMVELLGIDILGQLEAASFHELMSSSSSVASTAPEASPI